MLLIKKNFSEIDVLCHKKYKKSPSATVAKRRFFQIDSLSSLSEYRSDNNLKHHEKKPRIRGAENKKTACGWRS